MNKIDKRYRAAREMRTKCPHCGGEVVHVHAETVDRFMKNTHAVLVKGVVNSEARRHGVTAAEVLSTGRRQDIVRARTAAMRRCRDAGMTLEEIGAAFGRTHGAVWMALRRDNPWATGRDERIRPGHAPRKLR